MKGTALPSLERGAAAVEELHKTVMRFYAQVNAAPRARRKCSAFFIFRLGNSGVR